MDRARSRKGRSPLAWNCFSRCIPPKAVWWHRRLPFPWINIRSTWWPPVATGSLTRVETMDTFTPTINEAYLEYANWLLQHHRFLAEGKENADETLAVE